MEIAQTIKYAGVFMRAPSTLPSVKSVLTAQNNSGIVDIGYDTVSGLLGYTPVNKDGDVMTGGLTVPSVLLGSTGNQVLLKTSGNAVLFRNAIDTNDRDFQVGAGTFSGNVLPSVNGGLWLGSPTFRWNVIHASNIDCSNIITVGAGGVFSFGTTRSRISSPADNRLCLLNQAQTDFSLLQFGGVTNAFPAIKRVGANLETRLADDSGFCSLTANTLNASSDVVTNNGAFRFGGTGPSIRTGGTTVNFQTNNGGARVAANALTFLSWQATAGVSQDLFQGMNFLGTNIIKAGVTSTDSPSLIIGTQYTSYATAGLVVDAGLANCALFGRGTNDTIALNFSSNVPQIQMQNLGKTYTLSVNDAGSFVITDGVTLGTNERFYIDTSGALFTPTGIRPTTNGIGDIGTNSVRFSTAYINNYLGTSIGTSGSPFASQWHRGDIINFNAGSSGTINYERGYQRWNSNVYEIGNEHAGTGSIRNMAIKAALELQLWATGVNTMTITGSDVRMYRHILFPNDNIYDIGISNSNRPRHIYIGGNAVAGGTITAAGKVYSELQEVQLKIVNDVPVFVQTTAPLYSGGPYFWIKKESDGNFSLWVEDGT